MQVEMKEKVKEGKQLMNKIFGIATKLFIIATFILAIAIAYVFGFMEGFMSQQQFIKELMEELHPSLIVDYGLWVHPLWYPLLTVAFIFGVCWIFVAVITFQEKKKKQT